MAALQHLSHYYLGDEQLLSSAADAAVECLPEAYCTDMMQKPEG